MQFYSCEVALNGNIQHTVPKPLVSAAEVAVLMSIHGKGSISNLQHVKGHYHSRMAEVERLSRTYGARRVLDMYPGLNPNLPTAVSDFGLEEPQNDTQILPNENNRPSGDTRKADKLEAQDVVKTDDVPVVAVNAILVTESNASAPALIPTAKKK